MRDRAVVKKGLVFPDLPILRILAAGTRPRCAKWGDNAAVAGLPALIIFTAAGFAGLRAAQETSRTKSGDLGKT